jgi:hypothetical protein
MCLVAVGLGVAIAVVGVEGSAELGEVVGTKFAVAGDFDSSDSFQPNVAALPVPAASRSTSRLSAC